MWLAQALEKSGNLDEAVKVWRRNFENCSRDHGAEHSITVDQEWGLARTLTQLGKAELASPMLKRVIAFAERTQGTNAWWPLDAQYWLGQTLEQSNQVEEAAQIYRSLIPRVARFFPSNSAFFINRCITDFFLRHRLYADAKSANEPLRAWFQANPPDNSDGFENFIRATGAAKGWPAAAKLCRKNIALFADSMKLSLRKAWVFLYVNDQQSYETLVRKALELAPSLTNAADQHRPIELAALGQQFIFSEEQRTLLDALLAKIKDAPPADRTQESLRHRSTAHLHLRLDRYEDCLAALEKAERTQNAPDPYNLFLKAIVLHKLKRHDEAKALFTDAQSLSDSQLPQPIEQSLDFVPLNKLYQQIVLGREAKALIFSSPRD